MIPKVIHRIWLDDPVPETFAGYWMRFGELHPGWELRDWRDSDSLPWDRLRNRDLIRGAEDVFPRDWKRFQADLLRLELLWLYGGIYVDADVEPLRSFDPLIDRQFSMDSRCFVPYSPNRGPRGQRLLSQFVLGSEPEHPFIGACLDAVPASLDEYAGKPLAKVVGPWMITRVFESQAWPGVLTLPEQAFGPQSIRDRGRGRKADTTGSFAVHQWNSSARRRGKGAT